MNRYDPVAVARFEAAGADHLRLLEPDPAPPVARIDPSRLSGVHRLLIAVLNDAMDCLALKAIRNGSKCRQRTLAQAEAEAWFRSTSQRSWGFEWVCDHVGISASAMRAALGLGG